MNNFPAMTEAQRQELIADCKISISNLKEALRCAEINGWEQTAAESMSRLLRQQIALAALTAEPDHYVFHHPAGKLLNHLASDECKGQEHVVAGYTALPAPVMKSIKLNGDDVDTPIDWYAGAKTRDMVIDVIRAAGYDVKQ